MEVQKTNLQMSELLQSWLMELQGSVRPTSYTIYQSEVQNHILPELGGISLDKLTASTGEGLSRTLVEKGLSPRMVNDVIGKLGQALRWGLDNGYDVPILKQATMDRGRRGLRFLTAEEQKRLEASLTVENRAFVDTILLALRGGLTIGEICALSWQDMDLEGRTMKIHQICQRVTGGLTYLETEARTVSIPEGLDTEEGARSGFFIRPPRGGTPEPRLCQFWLKKHLKESALPEDLTYAALRNTYIRDLMEAGTDFIQISRLSGCKDLNELWKKYGTFYRSNGRKSTEEIR